MRETLTPLIAPEAVEDLGAIYRNPDRAFPRVKSRAAIDGGQMLLAIVEELRNIKKLLEQRHPGGKGR